MSALPANALPLDDEQSNNLQVAVRGLSPQQLQWVSGYVAGLAAGGDRSGVVPVANAPAAQIEPKLTILYGSQTGNGEQVAEALADKAAAQGIVARTQSLADYKPANLKRETTLSFVISTHGEGDPPDDAELFYEYLMSAKAPQLDALQFSVLALGDSSYVNFCQTGREVDARLAELGAQRLEALVECDLDYEDMAADWSSRVIAALPELVDSGPIDAGIAPAVPLLRSVDSVSKFDKHNPFPAEVLVNQKITGGSSSKDVRHIELALQDSGLTYQPGDSLAVIADNPPALVAEFLDVLKLSADSPVTVAGESATLADALRQKLEITAVNLGFLREWSAFSNAQELAALLADGEQAALTVFVDTHQIIDVVRAYPVTVTAQQFVDTLRKLSPRSYSISSSLLANPDEVHLTVAAVRYQAFGTEHWGAASTHLADRLLEGDTVSVYVERNSRFRLPQADVPIVMIGPGTGVAPFRAFVEERVEQGASGDNWLIFGDRNFDSDFLYQLEWQRHLKRGNLQRLDVAFSRDQRHKVYVQDRIVENGAELYRWIDNGAAIYVCGDAKSMAGDVNDALLTVLIEHGGLQPDAASQALKELRKQGRYQRDVY